MTNKPSYSKLKNKVKKLKIRLGELKEIEKKLRKSEVAFQALIQSLPGMVYRAYPDRSAEVVSGCKRLCGYTEAEINAKDKNWLGIVHPDDVKKAKKRAIKVLKQAKTAVQIYRIITKNGDVRWVEDHGTSIFSKSGRLKGLGGVVIDITDRKQAEIDHQKAQIDTEQRVKARTLELSVANLQLNEKTKNLEESNTALEVRLKERAEDKYAIEEKVLHNIKELVEPYLNKLNKSGLDSRQKILSGAIETNLKEIISSFSHRLSSRYFNLSHLELQVANFVKQGKATKEIAEIMRLSTKTIESHRKNIRRKLNLTNTKTNLKAYLLSQPE